MLHLATRPSVVRPARPDELVRWDELIGGNPDGGHFLQSRAWADFKQQQGWQPKHLIISTSFQEVAALFLRRRIRGLGELWYTPKGPGVAREEQLLEVAVALRSMSAGAEGPFLIKIEPEVPESSDGAIARDCGLKKAPRDIQINRSTIVLDLRPSENELLQSFKPKTRYNVRLAARRGVRVSTAPPTDRHVDEMYRLMRLTGERASLSVRSRSYYAGYWRGQVAAGQGQLFFASRAGQVLAGAFVSHLAKRAWYKDGGSTRDHAELMAPYLLQWEIMRWLQSRGVRWYDLVGVPPRNALTPAHPFFGMYRFKSGFNQQVTQYVGTLDLPLSGWRYAIWRGMGERVVSRLAAIRSGDLF